MEILGEGDVHGIRRAYRGAVTGFFTIVSVGFADVQPREPLWEAAPMEWKQLL